MTKDEEKQKAGERLLHEIQGARLTSVDFVLDYLILGFDNKGALTTLVWPELTSDGETLAFGMPVYRDRLCEFIERVVENVTISNDERIVIYFQDRSRMEIPLQTKKSGERAIFNTRERGIAVW